MRKPTLIERRARGFAHGTLQRYKTAERFDIAADAWKAGFEAALRMVRPLVDPNITGELRGALYALEAADSSLLELRKVLK